MRRVAFALVTAGLVAGVAVPSFAASAPASTSSGLPPIPHPVISPPVHIWALANGGLCVQVEDLPPVCSQPQPM